MKKKILILSVLFYSSLFAQLKSNLEIFNSLIDSSAILIAENFADKNTNYVLTTNLPAEYKALEQQILISLVKTGLQIKSDSTAAETINYSLINAGVIYPEVLRNGIFGEYILKRKLVLSGEFTITNQNRFYSADKFSYSVTDSIPFDKTTFVETDSIPFTKGEKPSPPFLSGIIEPVIAITTVVVTAILFFSVRSK
jgi:hypothetical protein